MEHHESLFADPRAWVGVAFVIFFLIFGKKLWGVIAGMLDGHAAAIRAELDEAARLRQEAEAMLADARVQREAALRAAEDMMTRARDEAARVASAARDEAAASAVRRERLAMDRIAAAEKAAVTEVKVAAADIAARAAAKIIEQQFNADADSPAIDRAIQGLPVALGARRAA
jgi:F-type H+-transporting ATPase subunit b